MDEKMIATLHNYIKSKNDMYVHIKRNCSEDVKRIIKMHKKRGATIVRSLIEGDIIRSIKLDEQTYIEYKQREERTIKIKDFLYIEENAQWRQARFEKGKLKEDRNIIYNKNPYEGSTPHDVQWTKNSNSRQNSYYNRREAVRYAERWWNDYNPLYRQFTNNCTNFVSQCLYTGGAPMTGYPNREKGWWYANDQWSLSWAVAHSLRWYLSGAKSGLQAEEKERATDLQVGDVICYDFNGDGRWQHTTIVTAHDINNEPLVNAQTDNSRMRYWTYEDSTAWTPNIKYKFFHIV